MLLTKEEEKAVKASIRHWEEDIIKKFEEGLRVSTDTTIIQWSNGEAALVTGYNCPLCRLYSYYVLNENCHRCPYYEYYKHTCDFFPDEECPPIGHWAKFILAPTLKTAIEMRDALKKILE